MERLILIIDDEPSVKDILELMIDHLNYEVLSCNSYKEALNLYSNEFESDNIFLILLDYNIPNESFLGTAKEIKEKYNIDVVAITGGLSNQENENNLNENKNVFKVLKKPITINDLEKIIREVMDKYL